MKTANTEAPANISTATNGLRSALARVPELGRWELWLLLVVAAFLRLNQLGTTQFLDDQAELMTLARSAFTRAALPVTGIPSSIGFLNMPLSVYILMPFAAFSRNPLYPVAALALWNALGVALCYIFTNRYFGRLTAILATALFATAPAAVNYSRFLWQQNYIAPLAVLWALTLYAGCIRGSRRWFLPHVLILACMVQLHPTTLTLGVASLAGLLLAPRPPRRFDVALVVVAVCVLALPTLAWELASSVYDVGFLRGIGHHPAVVDGAAFTALTGILGGPDSGSIGQQSTYTSLTPLRLSITQIVVWLFLLGLAYLTAALIVRTVRAWYLTVALSSRRQRIPAAWRTLKGDARWRADLLLWLWVCVPVVALVRHASPVYTHYLLMLYPAVFIVASLPLVVTVAGITRLASRLRPSLSQYAQVAVSLLAVVAVSALTLAQAVIANGYTAALASGSFTATDGYGYGASALVNASARITQLAASAGASQVYVDLPFAERYQSQLTYLLVGEHSDRQSDTADCLLLPPAGITSLHVSAAPSSRMADQLAQLPGATHAATISLPGGPGLDAYRVTAPPSLLAGEDPIPPVTYSSDGAAIRLVAAARTSPDRLRLRWQVLDSTPIGAQPMTFAFSSGTDEVACSPSRWLAGETLFTWVNASTSAVCASQTGALPTLGVRGAPTPAMPQLITAGPLRFLADRPRLPDLHAATGHYDTANATAPPTCPALG